MLDYLTSHKWHSLAIIVGLALLYSLTGYWSEKNAATAHSDLLNGHYASAFEKYYKAAKDGDPDAQNALGNMFYMGFGQKRDYAKAYVWYRQAAINGNKPALINMGILYFQGLGVKQDLLKSFAWFRLGGIAGRESAETHLKYLSGINLITPNMIQEAKRIYGDVASLTKQSDSKLHSFESQPHLPPTENDRRIR